MHHHTYRHLPIDALYHLLTESIQEMLAVLDSRENDKIAFHAKRKQVEILLEVIAQKKPNNST